MKGNKPELVHTLNKSLHQSISPSPRGSACQLKLPLTSSCLLSGPHGTRWLPEGPWFQLWHFRAPSPVRPESSPQWDPLSFAREQRTGTVSTQKGHQMRPWMWTCLKADMYPHWVYINLNKGLRGWAWIWAQHTKEETKSEMRHPSKVLWGFIYIYWKKQTKPYVQLLISAQKSQKTKSHTSQWHGLRNVWLPI